jgi:DNA-directed RNA polymerase subunit M/transcription elongation factor TFIIS
MVQKTFYHVVSTPAEIRTRAVDMLNAVVGDIRTAKLLEKATWNHAVSFCKKNDLALYWDNRAFRDAYTHKVLGVRYVARERPDVLQKYMELDPTLVSFVNAKPHEICPDKWAKAFEDAARKALRFTDASAMDPELMPDGILTCKCGSRKTSYYEMQTRSADEPMTVFARCHMCSAKWKQ